MNIVNIYISYIEEKVQNEEVEEEEEEALIHRNAHVKIMEKNILMNHRHNQYHHLTTIYLLLSLSLSFFFNIYTSLSKE